METMVADTRKITKQHLNKWRGTWNDLHYDDLESESLFWLVTHYEQGFQLFSLKGYWPYYGWLKKSIDRMLFRWCQEQVVRSQSFIALGSLTAESEDLEHSQTLPVGLTYYMALEGLKNGSEPLLLLAVESCTDKQYYAIKRVLFDGEKVRVVAEEMGVVVQTVKFHIDRGVHNMVSKAVRK